MKSNLEEIRGQSNYEGAKAAGVQKQQNIFETERKRLEQDRKAAAKLQRTPPAKYKWLQTKQH